MNNITEIQDQIVEEFEMFDEWMDKYEHIIELGKRLEPMPENYKNECNLVKGCQSNVWISLEPKKENGITHLHFYGDSDALITKGLVALVLRVVQNQPATEIAECDFQFIEKIGLSSHLSMNRSNGLSEMVAQIKLRASQID